MSFPEDFYPPEDVRIYAEPSVVNWFVGDIYHIYALPNVVHNLEDAIKQTNFLKEELGDKKIKILLDIRRAPSLSVDARDHYASEEGQLNVLQTAVVISSPFSRTIANFYLGVFKPSIKTKMFTSVEEAIKWLSK